MIENANELNKGNNSTEISNEEIIQMSKDFINNEDYENYNIDYIIRSKEEKNDIYVFASNYDDMIEFNPLKNDVKNVFDWAYNFDDDIFSYLEQNKEIIYMTPDVHYAIWLELSEYYPIEYNNKKGIQEYLKYCKKNNITKEFIEKKNNKIDSLENIMKYYKGKSKEQER